MEVVDGDADGALEDLELSRPAHERTAGHAVARGEVATASIGASSLVCVTQWLRHDGRIVVGVGFIRGVGALFLA